ncbi:ATP-binding protein, CobQ/CobB/MinD/ParA family [Deferribacter desulfuricans SSM1]|uniref:Iron-sulfur cluster carrier protein n=1 Tax=Deferribacter desulfuricans (strain DSM 14783 / JCM 11476 / NBRC 101012 / SSM1) TaxID=639282 RepID=D3PDR2_DEFDS|nr:Mrp/NBP35 family ATP-binding protein [Deferribacter desulfuricans]BAI80735.1 ATP-binding protein, CobQ/CobB/MinD/ParA family [Deferribacter desulfuricans SSM1]
MSSCNSNNSCSSCSSQNSCDTNEKEQHTKELLRQRLSKIKCTLMVMSGKGGVGKSTVSTNLAAMLNMLGHKVGILDADIHGPNIPKMLGINEKGVLSSGEGIIPFEPVENLKVMSVAFLLKSDDDAVIWRAPLKHSLIEQFISDVNWGELDFLIIDLPPGTGDEPLSVAHVIEGVDGSIIVTTPQEVALLDSRKSVTFSRKLNIPVLGIVENMSGFVCPNCGEKIDLFKVGGGEKAAKELNVDFLGRIPIDPSVVLEGDAGKPYILEHPDSEVSKAFKEIAEKVIAKTLKK